MQSFLKTSLLIAVLLLISSCQTRPKFINHPRPDLTIPFKDFSSIKCSANDPCLAEISALGCDEVSASYLLGGLLPAYPIAECIIYPYGFGDQAEPSQEAQVSIQNGEYFFSNGGLLQAYTRYLIVVDKKFQVIKTRSEFRQLYAPIENPDEALSYALGMTGLDTMYDLAYDRGYEYKVSTIEDTHVEKLTDGYLVHLFGKDIFGCGPHWTYAVDVQVSFDGTTEQSQWVPIFRNKDEDGMCVD
jgi:hypothetical protein